MTRSDFIGQALAFVILGTAFGFMGKAILDTQLDPKPPAPRLIHMANGQWFVPAGSGLGPPLTQVKAFVLYNGDVCLHVPLRPVASMEEIVGLQCVPASPIAHNESGVVTPIRPPFSATN